MLSDLQIPGVMHMLSAESQTHMHSQTAWGMGHMYGKQAQFDGQQVFWMHVLSLVSLPGEQHGQ